MNTTRALMLFLFTGSLASAACVVEKIDTDNEDGGGGTTSATGGAGGQAEGGGGAGGDAEGGAGGMSEGGGGQGGGPATCFDDCDAMHPNGIDDLNTYVSCITCSACYDICDGGVGDVCSSGAEDPAACSETAEDCQTCINGSCASDVDGNGQTTGVCGAELGTFLDNQEAVLLNECYNGC